jgi:CspA family cold shock protein
MKTGDTGITGKVKFYDTKKNFGFIIELETMEEIFFHMSGLVDKNVAEGDDVVFDVATGRKGLNAVNIERL